MNKIILMWLVIVFSSFATIKIDDETGVLSKDFIKNWEKQYTSKNKEIHVLVKESVGNVKPVIYGADYFDKNDLGGEGSGILILIYTKTPWIQVIIGYKVEELFTDYEINTRIFSEMKPYFYKDLKKSISVGIESSIKILDEVVK